MASYHLYPEGGDTETESSLSILQGLVHGSSFYFQDINEFLIAYLHQTYILLPLSVTCLYLAYSFLMRWKGCVNGRDAEGIMTRKKGLLAFRTDAIK